MTTPFRKQLLNAAILSTALLCGLAFNFTTIGNRWNNAEYDLLVSMRGENALPTDALSEIVIVAIDQTSFEKLNLKWPWPRKLHAQLIKNIFAAGAKTIALDVEFSQTVPDSKDKNAKDDLEFSNILREHSAIILAKDINKDSTSLIFPTANYGFSNFTPDADKVIRRTIIKHQGQPSLALAAANSFIQSKNNAKVLAETDNTTSQLINFKGPATTFKTVSYSQALDAANTLPKDYFKNKIVFVGFASKTESEIEPGDVAFYPTPFSLIGKKPMSGVEIHANITANILSDNFIRILAAKYTLCLGMLIAAICGYTLLSLNSLNRLIAIILANSFIIAVIFYCFDKHNYFIPTWHFLAPLNAVFLASFVAFKMLPKSNIPAQSKKTFDKNSVTSTTAVTNSSSEVSKTKVTACSILILKTKYKKESDTSLKRECSKLIEKTVKTSVTIVKQTESELIAICTTANSGQSLSHLACQTALKAQKEIRATFAQALSPVVNIAIHAGTASIYTDATAAPKLNIKSLNITSALNDLNDVYGTEIIISGEIARDVLTKLRIRQLDTVSLNTEEGIVSVYELCEELSAATDVKLEAEFQMLFQLARDDYQHRRWPEAIGKFEQALKLKPTDQACQELKVRAELFLSSPPPADWNGAYKVSTGRI